MAVLIPIMLEVEPAALGGVLLKLKDLPGVKIHLNLDGAGPTKKTARRTVEGNGHSRVKKNPDAPTGNSIIIAELMDGQKNLAHLKTKLGEHGLSQGNTSSTLHALTQKGIVDHIGVGLYQLSERARKELQPDAPPPASALQLPAPPKSDRGASRPFVLKCIAEGKTRMEMRKAGEPLGINERMIDGALTRLKGEKAVVAVEGKQGLFRLTQKTGSKSK